MGRDALSRRTLLSALGTTAAVSASGCLTGQTPRISVRETVLRDEVTPVRLREFPANTSVTVSASATVGDVPVTSETVVETDGDGSAVVGDIEDPAAVMAWLWSMTPTDDGRTVGSRTAPSVDVELTASVDGTQRASATQTRRRVDPAVRRRSLDRGDLAGELFVPDDDEQSPGVLVLHGSGGDPLVSWGRILASHGLAALAVDYFGPASGNPRHLANVPLSYFDRAAETLRAVSGVRDGPVGVVGASRGSEAALLLGAHRDWVGAVVALAPSLYVWRGSRPGIPAWTRDGDPIPFLAFPRGTGEPPRPLTPVFRRALRRANDEQVEAATIPIERADAPLLFVSGEADRLWPAATFADRAMARLREHGLGDTGQHRSYENAGHAVSLLPYQPMWWTTATRRYALGGTVAGNARAVSDVWQREMTFLLRALDD